MQRSSIMAGRNLRVSLASLRKCMIARERDDTMQPGVETLEPGEVDLCQSL
jgi:bifunctional N-acetylglucosamine-1-phosphate-uridyltransferase/glucosamine-1-phosphate-acetyltransferase GlmU-like protein